MGSSGGGGNPSSYRGGGLTAPPPAGGTSSTPNVVPNYANFLPSGGGMATPESVAGAFNAMPAPQPVAQPAMQQGGMAGGGGMQMPQGFPQDMRGLLAALEQEKEQRRIQETIASYGKKRWPSSSTWG